MEPAGAAHLRLLAEAIQWSCPSSICRPTGLDRQIRGCTTRSTVSRWMNALPRLEALRGAEGVTTFRRADGRVSNASDAHLRPDGHSWLACRCRAGAGGVRVARRPLRQRRGRAEQPVGRPHVPRPRWRKYGMTFARPCSIQEYPFHQLQQRLRPRLVFGCFADLQVTLNLVKTQAGNPVTDSGPPPERKRSRSSGARYNRALSRSS